MRSKRFPYVVTFNAKTAQGEFLDRAAEEQDISKGQLIRNMIDEAIKKRKAKDVSL